MSIVEDKGSIIELIGKKKVLIFDFDGVLVDSVGIKSEAFGHLYKEHGDEIVKKVTEYHLQNGGMSRYQKFAYYEKELLGRKASSERVEQLSADFSSRVVTQVVQSDEIPGAKKFIKQQLVTKYLVINSATPENEIKDIINKKGWSDQFGSIYGSPSSKTDNINKIIKKLGVMPIDCLFFGDAHSDWYASQQTQIDFIGIGCTIKKLMIIDENSHYYQNDFLDLI